MRIYFIRHAEPAYPKDKLTPQGEKELIALSKYYSKFKFDYVYSSPLIRAYKTAKALIKDESKINIIPEFTELDQTSKLDEKYVETRDILPSKIISDSSILNKDYLNNYPKTNDHYDKVINKFDQILEKHGYKRDGLFYKVNKSNKDTIVIFSHFGVSALLISRLLNIPYITFTEFTCCQPTGVTEFISEEREEGLALFRMLQFGNVSHIINEDMKPTFLGRFCETFDSDERH